MHTFYKPAISQYPLRKPFQVLLDLKLKSCFLGYDRFGNTAYLHISVAFIQMLKALSTSRNFTSFFFCFFSIYYNCIIMLLNLINLCLSLDFVISVPVATFIMAIMCGTDKPRCDVFLNMVLVSVGVVISSYGEIHFNVVGTLYQVTGIFAEALRLVLTQVLLQKKGLTLNPVTSLYYIAPCRCAFLCFLTCFYRISYNIFWSLYNVLC